MIPPVWMFHRVLPDTPQAFGLPGCYRLRGTGVTPDEWEAFLDSVEATVALPQAAGANAGAVLTFDDGYREWVDYVAPSLRRRGFTATFFACRAFSSDVPSAHAVDRLYWLLDHARSPGLDVVVCEERVSLRVDTLAGKRAAISGALKERVVGGEPEEVDRLLQQVAVSLDCAVPADLPARLYPTMDEWRTLALEFDVGAHGLTHRRSTSLSDGALLDELEGSLRWTRELGGIDWWCHPDGDNDDRVRAAVERVGFVDAMGVEAGIGRFDQPRRFATPEAIKTPHASISGDVRRTHVAHG